METKKAIYTVKSARYGITNMFSTLLTTVATTFWALFLTSAVGLETAMMATILTLSSTVDLISIPLCGFILQKAKFKKGGKFRPWLLIGGIGAALLRWLSFTDLGLSTGGQAIWFTGTYVLTYVFFNLAYSAFTGLLPVMAKNPQDRVSFASARVTFNSIGKFLFSLTSVGLIGAFSRFENDPRGYSIFALVIAVLVIFGFVQLFFAAKKDDVIEVYTDTTKEGSKQVDQYQASVWEMIKFTITKPFLLYLLSSACKGTTYFIITGLAAYYYTYVVGNKGMLTVYLTASTFLMICGAFITPFVSKLLKGSRNTFIFGNLLYGLCLGSAYFFGKTAVSFTVIMCLGYLGYAFAHASEVAVYSTVVDYTKWKNRKDLKPFMMTLFSLTPKIGTTIGSAVLGFGLVAVGFVKTNVTPGAIEGIRTLLSGLPAALTAISVIAMILFPLTEKKVLEMYEDMNRQDQEAKTQA